MRPRQQATLVGLSIEINWSDEDVFDVVFSAWNGAFGGAASLYVEIGGVSKLADAISGFPRDTKDTREVEVGAFSREFAGGGGSMRFFCIDQAGHAYVECRVDSGTESAGVFQTVRLVMPVEAWAIDQFATQLRRLEREKKGIAVLAVGDQARLPL